MNATEEWYHREHLESRIREGDLLKAEFEKVKVILVHPDKQKKRRETSYLPDFYCINAAGETEMHEVKGFCDEADRLKIKMAAEQFPEWRWYLVQISGKKIKKVDEF